MAYNDIIDKLNDLNYYIEVMDTGRSAIIDRLNVLGIWDGASSSCTLSEISSHIISTFTVTFNANGHGTAPSSQTITYGSKVTRPSDPSAAGYSFGGWYTNSGCTTAYDFNTAVTSSFQLYAKWTIVSYVIAFNANGHGTAPSSQTITYGSKVSKPTNPSATGYTFGGWYTNSGCTTAYDFNTAVASSFQLYAKWTIVSYTITYNTKGGSTTNPTTYTIETPTTNLTNASLDGWEFNCWLDSSSGGTISKIGGGSIGHKTITAMYTRTVEDYISDGKQHDSSIIENIAYHTLYYYATNWNNIVSHKYGIPLSDITNIGIKYDDTVRTDYEYDNSLAIPSTEATINSLNAHEAFFAFRMKDGVGANCAPDLLSVTFEPAYYSGNLIKLNTHALNWFSYSTKINNGYFQYSICEAYDQNTEIGYYNHVTNASLGIVQPCVLSSNIYHDYGSGYVFSHIYNIKSSTNVSLGNTSSTPLKNLLTYTYLGFRFKCSQIK